MAKRSYIWGAGNRASILADKDISIKKECILPDSGELWHFHKSTHQWFLPLSGDLLIQTQKGDFQLKAEECISVPPLLAHKVWNISANPTVFYLISTNNNHEDKLLLEYEYPPIEELNFKSDIYAIRTLEANENTALTKLLLANELHLKKHFKTSYEIIKDPSANLIHQLINKSIKPFGIFLEGELVGYTSVKNIIYHSYTCEIAYWVDRNYQQKGIMTKVLSQFLTHLSLDFGFRNFIAKVHPENNSSIALLKKLKFYNKELQDSNIPFVANAKSIIQTFIPVKVLRHNTAIAPYFKKLNEEWIGELFEIEEADKKVLDHPEERIIKPGGEIFYIQINGEIISTGAVMPLSNGEFELTKMATSKKHQGLGFGELIIQEAINWAKLKGLPFLILYTQSTLFKALKLYKKYGFEHEKFDSANYKRADVKMKLKL